MSGVGKIVQSTEGKMIDNVRSISNDTLKEKATLEYKKYKAKTLSNVESEYLKTITTLEKQAKAGDKLSKANNKKGGKA